MHSVGAWSSWVKARRIQSLQARCRSRASWSTIGLALVAWWALVTASLTASTCQETSSWAALRQFTRACTRFFGAPVSQQGWSRDKGEAVPIPSPLRDSQWDSAVTNDIHVCGKRKQEKRPPLKTHTIRRMALFNQMHILVSRRSHVSQEID